MSFEQDQEIIELANEIRGHVRASRLSVEVVDNAFIVHYLQQPVGRQGGEVKKLAELTEGTLTKDGATLPISSFKNEAADILRNAASL